LAMIEMFPCFLCLFAFALMNFFFETWRTLKIVWGNSLMYTGLI
jgi:hypothetical protein